MPDRDLCEEVDTEVGRALEISRISPLASFQIMGQTPSLRLPCHPRSRDARGGTRRARRGFSQLGARRLVATQVRSPRGRDGTLCGVTPDASAASDRGRWGAGGEDATQRGSIPGTAVAGGRETRGEVSPRVGGSARSLGHRVAPEDALVGSGASCFLLFPGRPHPSISPPPHEAADSKGFPRAVVTPPETAVRQVPPSAPTPIPVIHF